MLTVLLSLGLFTGCGEKSDAKAYSLTSPNGSIEIRLTLVKGAPKYQVLREKKPVILPSGLGFKIQGEDPLDGNFVVAEENHWTVDETWTQPWGEVAEIRDHHNAMKIVLQRPQQADAVLILDFRAYNDGVAFRYEIPEQAELGSIEIMDELTEFKFAGDHASWWIPAHQINRYEYLYSNTPISTLDTVHTPFTMETADGLYLSIHEAALTDYASMTLAHKGRNTLECDLVPWSDGVKVRGELPVVSPWRTIQIAESAGDLVTSYLVLNCNEPNVLEDISWIKPGKYVGMWWGIHIGKYTFNSGEKHGATTENAKRYIDFAAKHGFDGVLVEGWNIGWDGDWFQNKDQFRFTESYPDYDLEAVSAYAAERGVNLIAHNETCSGIDNYERQIVDAYELYRSLGIKAIKSGYAADGRSTKRTDPETGALLGIEWHHGQYMVNHYRRVVELAARYGIMLDVHEPIKDTGIRRTYPNMMTREGARGQEYNAWSVDGGNPPEHTAILPFTRMLAGPFDHTPGIFDLYFEEQDRPNNRVNTTIAKQLALYVVLYSPWNMAADLPDNYEGHPAFQFIKDVPVDWAETVALNGKIGDYVTIARKDRNSQDWYLGSLTDEAGRTFSVPLSFLDAKTDYIAEIYADGPDADWLQNPLPVDVRCVEVSRSTELQIDLAPGGGQAIRFIPVSD
ncbi:glycoside hydrolase family 97 protein [Candidatus Neomarinimicrobiota bacterium]